MSEQDLDALISDIDEELALERQASSVQLAVQDYQKALKKIN